MGSPCVKLYVSLKSSPNHTLTLRVIFFCYEYTLIILSTLFPNPTPYSIYSNLSMYSTSYYFLKSRKIWNNGVHLIVTSCFIRLFPITAIHVPQIKINYFYPMKTEWYGSLGHPYVMPSNSYSSAASLLMPSKVHHVHLKIYFVMLNISSKKVLISSKKQLYCWILWLFCDKFCLGYFLGVLCGVTYNLTSYELLQFSYGYFFVLTLYVFQFFQQFRFVSSFQCVIHVNCYDQSTDFLSGNIGDFWCDPLSSG